MPRLAYYKPVLQDFPSPPTCLDLPRLAYNKPVLQDFPSPPTCLDLPRLAYYKPDSQDFPSPPTCLDLPRLAYYKPVLQDFPSPPTCLPHFRHRKLTPTTTTAAKEKRASREWDPLAGASCALSSQRVTRGSGNLAGHPSRSHPTLPQVWLLIQKRGLGIPFPRTSRVAGAGITSHRMSKKLKKLKKP